MKILTLTLIFTLLLASSVQATSFRDVPANHFALEAIRWVSSPANGSYMVGDAANNFNPGRVMDSFETAITLAMSAGFKYSPASITPAEQAFFDRAYERHGQMLRDLATQHPNWRSAANREIAFLLELGILSPNDLANFMSSAPGGTEVASRLTKEAAAAFMMRLSGNREAAAALTMPPATPFSDDADLNPMYRRYAYLAHELGVVTDYDGAFLPGRHVSRAELAQMFHSLRIAAPGTPGAIEQAATSDASTTPVPPVPPAPTPSPFASTFHGTIEDVQEDGIQITSERGTELHPFSNNPIVVVDNVRQQNASALEAGMLVAVGLNAEGQIISLLARSDAPTVTLVTDGPVPPSLIDTRIDTRAITVLPPTLTVPSINIVWLRGEGIITAVTVPPAQPTVSIQSSSVRLLTGEVVTEEKLFPVTEHTSIMRDGEVVPLSDIRLGEIVTFLYSDYAENILHAVHLPERNLSIHGDLVGDLSEIDGILEEIHITRHQDAIMVRREDGLPIRLILPSEVFDIYLLRLGMNLELSLNNRIISELTIANGGAGTGFVATIQSLRHGHTMVVSHSEDNRRQTIRVDGNTINTATGETLYLRDLRTQTRLYIVLAEDSNIARSVTVLP